MKRHFSKQSLLRTMMIVATLLFMMPAQKAWADDVATLTVGGNTYTYSSLESAVNAANSAPSVATITLLKDITEQTCSLEVSKSMIIDLNGHVVNANSLTYAYGIFSMYNAEGQIIIKNGTISRSNSSNSKYAIYNYGSNLGLENVIVKNTYSTANPCLYNSGTLTISKGITLVGHIDNSGTVQIASGQTLNDIGGNEYNGDLNSTQVAALANTTLYTPFVTVKANGTTTPYNSLESAISAATSAYTTYGAAATVKLYQDIDEKPCSLRVTKPMIVDLNNHRINTTDEYPFFINLSTGQMTIKNGSVRGRLHAVYLYGGEAVLENITAEAPSSGSNCVRVCSGCSLTVSKGITFDASIYNQGTVQIASGQTLCDANGKFYSGNLNPTQVAALTNNTLSTPLVTMTVNGATTYYNSLKDAVSKADSAQSVATITLNHDITEQPCSLMVTKPMIIDLNGHVVNADSLTNENCIFTIFIFNDGGKVIIKNGTISRRNSSNNKYVIRNISSNLELENVTVKNTYSAGYPCLFNSGTLTVSKGITLVGSIYNSGTVKIADGQVLSDESENYYLGTLTPAQVSVLANNTLSSFDCLLLADNSDNASVITNHISSTIPVALQGRTLYKDGAWNTIVLPFDVDLTADGCPLAGAEARTLTAASIKGTTLNLTFGDAVTTLVAGTPYIIKWASGTNITNPVFTDVTISDATNNVVKDYVTFCGTYAPITWTEENKSILFLGDANTLYFPQPSGDDNPHLNAFRAYFQLNGITAGEVSTARMTFDDNEVSGIVEAEANSCVPSIASDQRSSASPFTLHSSLSEWYTLDGRKLNSQPTRKGLYFHNGRVVVK